MTAWVIWYRDKTSFSSDDGEPWDAPRDNVICVSVENPEVGRHTVHGCDYYCWHFEDEIWVPHGRTGLHQYLRQPGKEKVVLEGYWVPRNRWTDILKLAKHDPRMLPQTGQFNDSPENND